MARRIGAIKPDTVLKYNAYWGPLTAQTPEQCRDRWIFALLSGQTGWRQNVESYLSVTSIPWETKAQLRTILEATRCGLYTAKTKGIWHVMELYRKGRADRILMHPAEAGWVEPREGDTPGKPRWVEWRDKLVSLIDFNGKDILPHVGHKIAAFAHELCFPMDCKVAAVDTHVASWYGVDVNKTSMTPTLYHALEKHWVATCDRHNYPPAMVRHILWDQIQGFEDTRYWAHVFEQAPVETGAVVG